MTWKNNSELKGKNFTQRYGYATEFGMICLPGIDMQ